MTLADRARARTPPASAAIAFKPQSSGEFRSAFDDVDKLIEAVAQQCGSQIERKTDEYGFDWIIVRDPDLEDLVATAHTLASELTAKGFGAQLLAATFQFEGGEHPVYWIYGFKRGAYLAVRAARRPKHATTRPSSS